MRDRSDTIMVFTSETLGSLLSEGGSQAWKLSASRAAQCTWLLCVRNRVVNARPGRQGGSEAHNAGFLLGRISAVVPPTKTDAPDRWKITFGEFAHIHCPELWDGGQNPVRYACLEALGIAPAHLAFRPIRLWNGWSGMPGPTGYRPTPHENAPLPPTMSLPGMAAERQRR